MILARVDAAAVDDIVVEGSPCDSPRNIRHQIVKTQLSDFIFKLFVLLAAGGSSFDEQPFLGLLLKEEARGKDKADEMEEEDEDEELRKLRLKQRIDQGMEKRSSFTRHVLLRVCDALQRQKKRNDELTTVLQQSAGRVHSSLPGCSVLCVFSSLLRSCP